MEKHPGLKKAIEKAGTAAALARAIGISRQALGDWDRVPAEQIVAVERATGIPRNELRPDLYDTESAA